MDGSSQFQGRLVAVDCVQWSADAELALAFADHIEILIPRYPLTQNESKRNENSRWHVTRIKAHVFSIEEVPLVRPLPLSQFSVGVEQSASHTVALAWSAPGLARNGRCALAVLTSNHVLSLWTPGGRVPDSDGWQRVFTVNHCFENVHVASGARPGASQHMQNKRYHIKAFAWSCGKIYGQDYGHLANQGRTAVPHYIAAVSRAGELAIVHIESRDRTWRASKVYSENVDDLHSGAETTRPAFHVAAETMTMNLHWSPWIVRDDGPSSMSFCFLALVRSNMISFWNISNVVDDGISKLNIDDRCHKVQGSFKTGIGWLVQGDYIVFASATKSRIVYHQMTINTNQGIPLLQVRESSLISHSNAWNKISGRTSDPLTQTTCAALHSTSSTTPRASAYSVVVGENQASKRAWHERLDSSVNAYDLENSLGRNTVLKIWGLSSSPGGDYVACLSTLHPSQLLQYEQHARVSSCLHISYEGPSLQDLELSDKVETLTTRLLTVASFEGLHFSLARLLRAMADRQEPMNLLIDALQAKLRQSSPVMGLQNSHICKRQGCEIVLLQQRLYSSEAFALSMINEIQRVACLPWDEAGEISATHALNVAGAVLEVAKTCRPFGDRDALTAARCRYIAETQALTESPSQAVNRAPLEQCSLCGEAVPFDNIQYALCEKGHRFARCSISFRSIQAPGLSRHCRICKAIYLRAEELAGFDDNHDAPTLGSVIRRGAHSCVRCGGKFDE